MNLPVPADAGAEPHAGIDLRQPARVEPAQPLAAPRRKRRAADVADHPGEVADRAVRRRAAPASPRPSARSAAASSPVPPSSAVCRFLGHIRPMSTGLADPPARLLRSAGPRPRSSHAGIRGDLRHRQRADPLGRAPALPPAAARRGRDRRLPRRDRLPRLEPRASTAAPTGTRASPRSPPATRSTPSCIAAFHDRWQETVPGAIDGSVAILEALAAAGVPLYAITNFSGAEVGRDPRALPVPRTAFRDVVVSGREGLVKPDPRDLPPAASTATASTPEPASSSTTAPANVAGAAAVGLDAIRFTDARGPARRAGAPRPPHPRADAAG